MGGWRRCLYCKQLVGPGEKCVLVAHCSDHRLVHDKCFDAYEAALRGLRYPCPQCAATGVVEDNGKWTTTYVALADGETPDCAFNGCRGCELCIDKVRRVRARPKMPCPLCKGERYLATDPKPITEIVGWSL